MDITPLVKPGVNIINSYGDGDFVIAGTSISGSIFLTSTQYESVDINDVDQIDEAFLTKYLERFKDMEILLIGTGVKHLQLSKQILAFLHSHNINVEVMRSDAVCRTYNILATEDRQIAAFIIMV